MFKKRSAFFDSNFVYFILLAMFIVIRIISSTFTITSTWAYILNSFIQIGLMFALPFFVYPMLRKENIYKNAKSYGFKKLSAKAIIYSVLMGVIVYLLTIFIASFFSAIISLFGYESSSSGAISNYPLWQFLLDILVTAVLPGVCEEVAHRGMLLNNYKKMGAKFAILMSGLLFGLMHLNIEQFFYASIIGFFFGFVALFTENIWPCIIMHFMNNAIGTYLSFASVNNLFLGDVLTWFQTWLGATNPIVSFLSILIFIAILLFVLAFLTRRLFMETKVKQLATQANEIMKQKLREDLFAGTNYEEQIKNENNNDGTVVKIDQNLSKKELIFQFIKPNYLQEKYKPEFKDKIFLYSSLFISIITTIFTFIWGIL